MADLKELYNFKHWWALIAAAGAAIAVTGATKGSGPVLFIGLGLLLFGAGEWLNRPPKKEKQTVEGLIGFKVVDAHPWQPNALGVVLDVLGVALFGLGLFWLRSGNLP